ncbi:MAG: hypothetical protein K8I29_04615, partial [Alphaproteobacteria bacterium]|nr:hypothetical protein [Candidatus Nitrobium versatile]
SRYDSRYGRREAVGEAEKDRRETKERNRRESKERDHSPVIALFPSVIASPHTRGLLFRKEFRASNKVT